MDSQMIFRKLWWLFAMGLVSLVRESNSLKGPWISLPRFAKSGDTITFACDYDTQNVQLYAVKWYRNGYEFFRYYPTAEPAFMYFRLPNLDVDVDQSGPTKVVLRNVTKPQSSLYECEVSTDAPYFETAMGNSNMTVIDVPNSDPSLKVNQGSKISAECSLPSSDPPANITWFINNEQVTKDNPAVSIKHQSEGLLTKVSSKIEISRDSPDFLQGVLLLKCEANIYNIWNRTVEVQVKESNPSNLIAELNVSSNSSEHRQIDDLDLGKNI